MHVYKKPSGLWAYKIDIGKNPRTGKRQQKEKGGIITTIEWSMIISIL